jgi:hypothetical protein
MQINLGSVAQFDQLLGGDHSGWILDDAGNLYLASNPNTPYTTVANFASQINSPIDIDAQVSSIFYGLFGAYPSVSFGLNSGQKNYVLQRYAYYQSTAPASLVTLVSPAPAALTLQPVAPIGAANMPTAPVFVPITDTASLAQDVTAAAAYATQQAAPYLAPTTSKWVAPAALAIVAFLILRR